jgi:pyridoxal phosphate enzyme (YggS family)
MTVTPSGAAGTVDQTLEARYALVKQRIAGAARASGRNTQDIILVAVTKYAETDQVRSLIQLGHRDFGENHVQSLIQRAPMIEEFMSRRRTLPNAGHHGAGIADNAVRWHMIGHLQRNKAKKAVEICRLIHSVDSLRLAEEIQAAAVKRESPVDVLVQVNCSGERTKFGCPLPAAVHLAEQIDTMVTVRVRGLMTMAALNSTPEEARDCFARCRELFEEIKKTGVGDGRFDLLSMGMSNDFEAAIAEGANMIRVGSAIFGEHKPTDEHPVEG